MAPDSEEYFRFCSRVAGRYLHHLPHYEKPHDFHTPRFKQTQRLYRKYFGAEPDSLVWSYMGESGGCGGCSSEPPPLYEIDSSIHVRCYIRCGGIDDRFYKEEQIHSVLRARGVSTQLWTNFLKAIDTILRRVRHSRQGKALYGISVLVVASIVWFSGFLSGCLPIPFFLITFGCVHVVEHGLTAAGIRVLKNHGVMIGGSEDLVYLAGLDDGWSGRPNLQEGIILDAPLNTVPTVLLMHETDLWHTMDA